MGCEVLADDLQVPLDDVILAFQAGHAGFVAIAVVGSAVDALRGRRVDGIILGCTELPLLLGTKADGPDLINPAQLLADAAVRYAMT